MWLNDGAGVFTNSGQALANNDSFHADLGDLDGDGDLDAFVANRQQDLDQVWLNDGTGVFTEGATFESEDSLRVVIADFDADCRLDVFTTSSGDEILRLGAE